VITPAFAQSAAPGAAPDVLMQIVPFGLIFVIMYFLIIRPQQKRAKEQQAMISAVRRGDVVVTSGGIIGKVTKATDDNEVEVEIADNVRVRLLRAMITDVRSKSEPVKAEPAKAEPKARSKTVKPIAANTDTPVAPAAEPPAETDKKS
jgi:preprotein translocase subunit YajC